MSDFSRTLVELRRRAGFETPFAFYSKKGGKRVFGFSYVNYWKIESGKTLPKAERLGVLLTCLGTPFNSSDADRFGRAYLKALVDSETAYDWLMGLLGAPKTAAPATITERALKHAIHTDLHHLTPKQNQALLSDYGTYWSFVLLCVEHSSLKAGEMAKRLGLTQSELLKSLKTLEKQKLVKLSSDGTVSSPLSGKHVKFLPHSALSPAEASRIRSYQQRMIKENGTLLTRTYCLPRAKEMEMASYTPHLTKAVDAVHVYSSCEGGPSSALFLVEGNIYRLLPA